MALEHLHARQTEIITVLKEAVTKALHDCSQPEPQLVANLVYYIPQYFNAASTALTRGTGVSVRVGGIFVHQKPRVKVDNFPKSEPKSVEIGDVLFLTTHQRLNGTVDRVGLLLQAKKAKQNAKKLATIPDNPNQHHLYAYWPNFEYFRSGAFLNGKKRHVTGPNLYDGAKYLLLCDPVSDAHEHGLHETAYVRPHLFNRANTAQPTSPGLSNFSCFICELYNLIFGNAGRMFSYQPAGNNTNWDQVMTDLIESTAKATTPWIKRVSANTQPFRGQGTLFFTGQLISVFESLAAPNDITTLISGDNGKPPHVHDAPHDGSERGGISIIEFRVEDL